MNRNTNGQFGPLSDDGAARTESVGSDFRLELESLINKCSMENGSNTPDYILAIYLVASLKAFDQAVALRDVWYGQIGE